MKKALLLAILPLCLASCGKESTLKIYCERYICSAGATSIYELQSFQEWRRADYPKEAYTSFYVPGKTVDYWCTGTYLSGAGSDNHTHFYVYYK